MEPDGRDAASDRRRDALLKEYGEVASNFRLLTDIRFKLLAFLPIAAVATAALRGAGGANGATAVATLGLSLFGLLVTAALVSYNARNDQLYDELVGRAAYIERTIGLPDGAFANRPTSWLSIRLPFGQRWTVDHGSGVALIYGASVALWLFMGLYSIVQLAYGGEEPVWWVLGGALVLAIATTRAVGRRIRKQRSARQGDMRRAAEQAVRLARNEGFEDAAASPRFRTLCAGLRDHDVGASRIFQELVRARESDTAPRAGEGALAQVEDKTAAELKVEKVLVKVGKQAAYYADPERGAALRRHYGLESPDPLVSPEAYFVALITDLSPRWIDDVATGRR